MPSPVNPSARVIANRGKRVVMNKAVVDALYAGMADALIDLGGQIVSVATAVAPRDPEKAAARGVPEMADTGNFVVYGLGKKVGGDEGGTGKPRAMKTPRDQVVLGVWFSSPIAHLLELGTVKMSARPFLLPTFNRIVPGAAEAMAPSMNKRARSVAGGAAFAALGRRR